ncbi:hypothetical protein MKW94_012189 [Papaver nudicaule]|uniref:RecQ-mediated genome instability protein 1 n=1 Tax=Papaver nudicaule TaxID=74823 RepID=A0AA42B4G2_PAPNU|nr:hypothetical protein [Papaver nudicaule]
MKTARETLIRGSTDYPEEFSPRSIRLQNQEQSSDMKLSCIGVLPENVHTLPLADFPGPFVLQVNEIANILLRSKDSSRDRCLMLTMTDGVQTIYGFEHRPIEDLHVSATAGFKVLIHNANVRGGVLMLVPENMTILGGTVEDLEAARIANACGAVADDSTLHDAILSRTSIRAIGGKFKEIVIDNSNKLTAEDKAMPCTYLVHLMEDMHPKMTDDTSVIRCKIQGIMTGLSEYKYLDRTEYVLRVRFSDGSYTSKVDIHHNLVQRQIGLTPKQVNAYLSSPNGKTRLLMREAMAQYLIELSTLKCTLVVVMHKSSPFPVAVEIDSSVNDDVYFEGLELLRRRTNLGW